MSPQKIFKYSSFVLFGAGISLLVSTFFIEDNKDKSVYGYIEPVTLLPDEIPIAAKLDTGAVTASLSAKDIHIYKKKDKEYVRFEVTHPDISQAPVYDLPVVRFAKIKNRSSEGASETADLRPVVKMSIYFDGEPHNILVNLIDRSHFSTPMLIGRKNLKKFDAVVDGAIKNSF